MKRLGPTWLSRIDNIAGWKTARTSKRHLVVSLESTRWQHPFSLGGTAILPGTSDNSRPTRDHPPPVLGMGLPLSWKQC